MGRPRTDPRSGSRSPTGPDLEGADDRSESLTGWLDETPDRPAERAQRRARLAAADPVEAARQHLAETTLRADAGGRVGLELEYHLVDLARPGRRPTGTR